MRSFTAINKWQDWASFALGLGLSVSPWLAGYADNIAATANAVAVGLALALTSHFEVALDVSAEWLHFAAGVWLVTAPFMLGFGQMPMAMLTAVAVGCAVALLAVSALSLRQELESWWHNRVSGTSSRS